MTTKLRELQKRFVTLSSQILYMKRTLQLGIILLFIVHILVDFFAAIEFVMDCRKSTVTHEKDFLYIIARYDLIWYCFLTVNGLFGGPKMYLTRFMFGALQIYFVWCYWEVWKVLLLPYKFGVVLRIVCYIGFQNIYCPLMFYRYQCVATEQQQLLSQLEKCRKPSKQLHRFNDEPTCSEKSFFNWLMNSIEKAMQEENTIVK